jgi:hypothetical protein
MSVPPTSPYYVAYENPYPTPEPTPYDPDATDNPEQGPLDSTPATTDTLLTPDEAIDKAKQDAADAADAAAAAPAPEAVEPPLVTQYKANMPPEPTP